MLKKILFLLLLPLLLQAYTMNELFSALDKHSQTKADEMLVFKSETSVDLVLSKLYPTINLFASYDSYLNPVGVIAIPPNELLQMVKDISVAQPFSSDITRFGAKVTMPIFVKSIYTLVDSAKALHKSNQAQKRINTIKNEALIVGSNANFIYLEALKRSLNIKEKSLLETKKSVQLKVDNGRLMASALYKIDDSLNQISIAKNSIDIQAKTTISTIESLTGIVLFKPINMQRKAKFSENNFNSLEPLKEKIGANILNIKAQKEKLYPSLTLHGSYTYSQAEAYNNNKNIAEEYSNIGLILGMPFFDKSKYENISLAKVKLKSSQIALEKSIDILKAKSRMLQSSLVLLDNSQTLYEKSIQNKKKLLVIAKANFKSGRLSTEEYLRYEDDVVAEEANLYKTEALKWQANMQLAVIYANKIEEMVKWVNL